MNIWVALGIWALGAPLLWADSTNLQWNGSGCDARSDNLLADGPVLRIARSDLIAFIVQRGQRSKPKDSRKNCSVIINPSKGQQIAVQTLKVSGRLLGPKASQWDVLGDVSIQGQSSTHTLNLGQRSVQTESVAAKEASFESDALLWTDCVAPRALLVNFKQRLTGGEGTAQLDTIEIALAVRPCHEGPVPAAK